ncbi:Uma2 family endonuclease [Micromonospora zhanjiangensis]|uniref:Uma2 family endonuclease n=1 Tax=Micromonospora zhanjiangensis TaxID=1522057 RepID=A0ABV8KSM0_9ACTN
MPTPLDPLVDFDGRWTTELADRLLPRPELPLVRYECIDGRLVDVPTRTMSDTFGAATLIHLLGPAAQAVKFFVCGPVNLTFDTRKWIQPDVTVLHALPETDEEDKWVPARLCTLAVEFVSAGSRKQDFVGKPRRCAEGGVPYFMRVEIARRLRHASVEFLTLVDGEYQRTAEAVCGRRLRVSQPFEIDFDPHDLLL